MTINDLSRYKTVTSSPRSSGSKGVFLLFTAISLVAIIGIVGLAVDFGNAYVTKQRMQAYSDLAALRGTGLTTDSTLSDKEILDRSKNIVLANMALSGFSQSAIKSAYSTMHATMIGDREGVQLATAVSNKFYLLNVISKNLKFVNLGVTAKANSRSISLMIVIDRSQSMGKCLDHTLFPGQNPCPGGNLTRMQGAQLASKFILNRLKNGDQVGLVSFSSEATGTVHHPLTEPINSTNRANIMASMEAAIDGLTPDNASHTWKGIRTGTDELIQGMTNYNTLNQPNRGRIMLLFTKGAPADVNTEIPIPEADYTQCEQLDPHPDPRMRTRNVQGFPGSMYDSTYDAGTDTWFAANGMPHKRFFLMRLVSYIHSINEAIRAQAQKISVNVVGIGELEHFLDHGPGYLPRPQTPPFPPYECTDAYVSGHPAGLCAGNYTTDSITEGRSPAQDLSSVGMSKELYMISLANDQTKMQSPHFLPVDPVTGVVTLASGEHKEYFWDFPCTMVAPETPSTVGTEHILTGADRINHEWGKYVFIENLPELLDAFNSIIRNYRVRLVWQ